MEEDRPTAFEDLAYAIGFYIGYHYQKKLNEEEQWKLFQLAYPEIFKVPVLNDKIPEEETSR